MYSIQFTAENELLHYVQAKYPGVIQEWANSHHPGHQKYNPVYIRKDR